MGGRLPAPDGGHARQTLNAFCELYQRDLEKKLRIIMQRNKQQIIETKIPPYLGEERLTEIAPLDVLIWQNAIRSLKISNGLPYKDSCFRTVGNQLCAMLNHAVRYYSLPSNPHEQGGAHG